MFNGAIAIITGGASGIGKSLGEEFTKRGGEVILADRQIALAEEVASFIRASGGKALAVELDVTEYNTVEQLRQKTVQRTGRLDYMH